MSQELIHKRYWVWYWVCGQDAKAAPADVPAHLSGGSPNTPPSKCTLFRVGLKSRLPQGLRDHGHSLHMLHPGVTMDDDIMPYRVHEMLESDLASEKAELKCHKLV